MIDKIVTMNPNFDYSAWLYIWVEPINYMIKHKIKIKIKKHPKTHCLSFALYPQMDKALMPSIKYMMLSKKSIKKYCKFEKEKINEQTKYDKSRIG